MCVCVSGIGGVYVSVRVYGGYGIWCVSECVCVCDREREGKRMYSVYVGVCENTRTCESPGFHSQHQSVNQLEDKHDPEGQRVTALSEQLGKRTTGDSESHSQPAWDPGEAPAKPG